MASRHVNGRTFVMDNRAALQRFDLIGFISSFKFVKIRMTYILRTCIHTCIFFLNHLLFEFNNAMLKTHNKSVINVQKNTCRLLISHRTFKQVFLASAGFLSLPRLRDPFYHRCQNFSRKSEPAI